MPIKAILIVIAFLYIQSFALAEVKLGGNRSWVKFPGDDVRVGFGGRVIWFGGITFGVMGDFQRYDIGDNPEHRYTLFGASALFRYYLPLIAPYAGGGLYIARVSAEPASTFRSTRSFDSLSNARHTFNDPTINMIVGSQFPIGSISPFFEYQRVFYVNRSDFFGLNRASVFSVGVVFDITH